MTRTPSTPCPETTPLLLFVAAFRNVPPQTPAGLKDSTTMFLTATDQRKPQAALWRLLALIITVIGTIGVTAGSASALEPTSTVSSSGHSVVVGAETRVGVTNQNLAGSSARIPTVSAGCVGENVTGYDGFVLVSCVATNTPSAALTQSELSGSTLSNYNRFVKNLPAAAETPTITKLPGGAIEFSAKVPATNIPGSYATYTKVVGPDGVTTSFIKTTVAPNGSIVSVKQKFP